MNVVTFEVSSLEDVDRRARAAFAGEPQGARVSFANAELLFSLLTPNRWRLLRAMAGSDPMSIREAARRVGRDVKAVHGDVRALLDAGVLVKDDKGMISFPFDAIHVDVLVKAA